jgi:hypoxanthine phosphoribosyltransferase
MAATQSPHIPGVSHVIVPRDRIQRRVHGLAAQVAETHGRTELTVVGVLDGARVFLADLVPCLPMPTRVLTVSVRSYRGRARTAGQVEFRHRLQTSLAGRDVLVVDDIIDTGATLSAVVAEVTSRGPASCRTCVLLRKNRPRDDPSLAAAVDFVGFEIPDVFVVGYGLDFDGRYRNLPDVVALEEMQGDAK